MPYIVPIDEARASYPQFQFIQALTPSAQKAAFHVRDEQGVDLCLKLIAPHYGRDRLDREILALQSITHPNVVKLKAYVFSSTNGEQKHYIVEDYISGTDLSERLRPGEGWAPEFASVFFEDLCRGLSALATKSIVHRDLKPSNIRVRPDGTPVIVDFGLARHLDLPDITPTDAGAGIGTPTYFAPEQFTGTKHDIDCRTDLFSVGVLMHEALLGRHPFWRPNMSAAELRNAVCTSDEFRSTPAFIALPHAWKLLIGRLLEKHRCKRPISAAQVGDIIQRLRTAS
jgi:serine/threonine protein kinase